MFGKFLKTLKSTLPAALFGLACMQMTGKGAPAICEIKPGMEKQCHGKRVRAVLSPPKFIMQHPKLSFDKKESYWDFGDRQWIVLSSEIISCKGLIEVEGMLDAQAGPCEKTAKTHHMYCGVAISVDKWKCLP